MLDGFCAPSSTWKGAARAELELARRRRRGRPPCEVELVLLVVVWGKPSVGRIDDSVDAERLDAERLAHLAEPGPVAELVVEPNAKSLTGAILRQGLLGGGLHALAEARVRVWCTRARSSTVAPMFIATASACTISDAARLTTWIPTTRCDARSKTTL